MGTFSDGESGSSVRTKINAAIEKTEGTSAISTVDINGGAIDGVTLGTNSAVTDLRVDNIKVDSNEISATNTNGNVQVTPNGTGVVEVKGAGGNDGTLQLNCSVNSHGVKIKSPPHSAGASYTLTLPNNDGDASQFLQTDGSGTLSWAAAGGTGVTVHTNQAAMLTDAASASEGSLHYDTDANKLYVKQTSGFFLLATITNTTPTITSFSENTGGAGANNLTTGGTFGLTAGSNTVITINATDPDLETLVYSATVTSGTASDVISSPSLPISNQSGNTFTLVPVTSGSGGTITVRFDVSDGNNIANVTQSFSIAFSIADSNFTRLLMATDNAVGGNQSITDSSSTAHTITVTNHSLAGSFSPYRHGGYSTHFNGSTDYLTIADNAEHDFGTGEFSMEFFWKPETLTGNTSNIHIAISTGNDSSTQLIYHESNYWYFQGGSAGAVIINSSGTGAATVGQWNHVVLCRTGTTLSIFHNGTRTATATSSYDTDFSNATIGRYYGSSANYYIDGLVRDMRWLKGSSAYDATQTSITVPTEPLTAVTNTKLLLCHLPYIADGSSTGHTITLSGSTHTRPSSPYDYQEYSESTNGGSISFDGVSDSLQFTASADLQALGRTGTAATIEAWVYLNSAPATYGTAVYSLGTAGSTTGNNVLSFEIQNDRTLRAAVHGAYNTTIGMGFSTGTVPLKIWTHIALVLHSGTWTLYINGAADGTVSGYYPSGTNHSTAFVGRCFYGSDRDADMFVSDLRVTSDAQYTSSFTPPTAPLATTSNTKLHIKGIDAHVFDKSQVNNLQLIGGAAASTTQAKFNSTASVYFDGSDDYVQTPTSTIYNLGTNQFTVEFFFRTEVDAQGSLVYFMNNSTSVLGIFYWHTYNSLALYDSDWITGNDGSGSNNNSISTSTWHYGAITRDTSNLRVYIDGTQVHSGSNTTNYTTNNIRIGRHHSGAYLNGYIQDMRISIGKARYTGSSHTVPTSSLKG
tara:strand:- start:504 stop:3431 length:2928 start_codon:yes stop_codon:yes gene_type:complete